MTGFKGEVRFTPPETTQTVFQKNFKKLLNKKGKMAFGNMSIKGESFRIKGKTIHIIYFSDGPDPIDESSIIVYKQTT